MAELGRLGAQEFAPRRRVEIQVAHFNAGDARVRGGLRRALLAALGAEPPRMRRALGARGDRNARDGGDRGQRLAAKAERAHLFEVVEARDLAGGVARECQRQVLRVHAAAIVRDLELLDAALHQADADLGGAGIEAVLQQFLHHRGRALHHFAGGDLADQGVWKEANRGHGGAFFVALKYTGNRSRLR